MIRRILKPKANKDDESERQVEGALTTQDMNPLRHYQTRSDSLASQASSNASLDKAQFSSPAQLSGFEIIRRRMWAFYEAPINKFILQAVCYIALLIVYTLSTLPQTRYLLTYHSDQFWFYVTAAWMLTMFVEELRQATHSTIDAWWSSLWNRWDLVMYVMYLVSVLLRLDRDPQFLGAARVFYSLVAAMLWFRLARLYAVSRTLGPKLVMIQLMVKDIMVFLALMFVVFAGYAIALFFNSIFRTPTRRIHLDRAGISTLLSNLWRALPGGDAQRNLMYQREL